MRSPCGCGRGPRWRLRTSAFACASPRRGPSTRCYLRVAIPIVILAVASFEIAGWLPTLVIWWLKPWLDRTILFVLSRAAFNQQTTLAGSLGGAAAGVVRPDPARADAAAPVVLAGVDAAGLPARRRRLLGGAAPRAKAAPGRRRSGVPDHAGLQPVRARARFGVLLPDVLVRTRRPGARPRAVLRRRSERHDRRSRRRCPTPVPCCSSSRSTSPRASRSISTGGPRSRPGTSSRSSDVPSRGEAAAIAARIRHRPAAHWRRRRRPLPPAPRRRRRRSIVQQITRALEAVARGSPAERRENDEDPPLAGCDASRLARRGSDGSPGLPACLRGWGNRGGISCG